MQAVVLAAGLGRRLHPLTEFQPKPLIEILDRPLIDHVIQGLVSCGIRDITVVGGYCFRQLEQHIFSWKDSITIRVLENKLYREGNIQSLITASEGLKGDILIMNSDHIYPPELIGRFVDTCVSEIRVACDYNRELGDDDMKIRSTRNMIKGRERHVVNEIGKSLRNFDGGYIGMTAIPGAHLAYYLDLMQKTFTKIGPKANVEDILSIMATTSHGPTVVDLSDFGWIEIDTMKDLDRARECLLSGNLREFWNYSQE